MNKTVPWSIKGVGSDTREAAKEAARRSGKSLADWLDEVIADRAVQLGVSKSQVDAEGQLDAVAAELSRLAKSEAGPSPKVADMAMAPFSSEPELPVPLRHKDASVSDETRGFVSPVARDRSVRPARAARSALVERLASFEPRIRRVANGGPVETSFVPVPDEPRIVGQAEPLRTERLSKPEVAGPGASGPSAPTQSAARERVSAKRGLSERSMRDAVAEISRRQADLYSTVADVPQAAPLQRSEPAGQAQVTVPEMNPTSPEARNARDNASIGGARASEAEADAALEQGSDAVPRNGRAGTGPGRTDPEDSGHRSDAAAGSDAAAAFQRLARDLRRAIGNIDARPDPARGSESASDVVGVAPGQLRQARDPEAGFPVGVSNGPVPASAVASDSAGAAPELVPDFSRTVQEMRSLLERFRPGGTIDSLERRLVDLSAKMERGFAAPTPAALIEGLSRRVEEVHNSLKSQARGEGVDTRSLERLVRGLATKLEDALESSADFQKLESVVRDLSSKIEGAGSDPNAALALESQMAKLGDRLDRSEANLSSLDTVEQQLTELFSQLEQTRHAALDAAESAARTAARDTLRAAMQNPSISTRGGDEPSDVADQVARTMSELREQHEASDRRTQAALAQLNQTIEQLVDILARTPGGMPDAAIGPARVARRVEDGTEPRPGMLAGSPLDRRAKPGVTRKAEVDLAGKDPSDLLIEPGSAKSIFVGQEGRSDRSQAAPLGAVLPAGEGDGPASFIAAARRAAQAAQASAVAEQSTRGQPRPVSLASSSGQSAIDRARVFLGRHRRPLLLSFAGVVLLIGALELFKITVADGGTMKAGALHAPLGNLAEGAAGETSSISADRAKAQNAAPGPDHPQDGAAHATAALLQSSPISAADASKGAPDADGQVGSIKKAALGAPRVSVDPALNGLADGLRAQAIAGNAAAQYEVALRFAEGRTVVRDAKQAATWFDKAASQSFAPAQYRLGSAYEKGTGVAKDPAVAMAWYGRAAEAGNIRAMHNLAVMAAEGAIGKPDYAKAAMWFQKAAAFGVRDSQFNLAILYARGLGIEQSLAQSYTWFAVAAGQGDEDAAKKRDEVGQRLDAKLVAGAKAAADAFHAASPSAAANDPAVPPGGWEAAAAPAKAAPAGPKPGSPRVSSL